MLISPCKDCSLRVVGCHSSCSLYSDWKNKKDKELLIRKHEAEDKDLVVRSMLRKNKRVKQR